MIQDARIDGRKRRGAMTRENTYQKVLLAVYILADEDGLACDVPVARIASECGHSIVAVQRSIAMMMERGVVEAIDQSNGLNRRILVLMDHPKARDFIAEVKAGVKAKWQAEVRERIARREARREARTQRSG